MKILKKLLIISAFIMSIALFVGGAMGTHILMWVGLIAFATTSLMYIADKKTDQLNEILKSNEGIPSITNDNSNYKSKDKTYTKTIKAYPPSKNKAKIKVLTNKRK